MGTRGIIIFIFNGKKLHVYNQFDSYAHGLGLDLLKELIDLLKIMTIDELIAKFEKLIIIDDSKNNYKDANIVKALAQADIFVSNKRYVDPYAGYRRYPGSINKLLEMGKIVPYTGDMEFITYVIDFDNKIYNFIGKYLELSVEPLSECLTKCLEKIDNGDFDFFD